MPYRYHVGLSSRKYPVVQFAQSLVARLNTTHMQSRNGDLSLENRVSRWILEMVLPTKGVTSNERSMPNMKSARSVTRSRRGSSRFCS